ncbi:hypothetical protein GCM10018779_42630 [Streptomyces griseocarneus]|nr:hypothetical protein GCM10018779_42630 [Streptomyces griseocarneus]
MPTARPSPVAVVTAPAAARKERRSNCESAVLRDLRCMAVSPSANAKAGGLAGGLRPRSVRIVGSANDLGVNMTATVAADHLTWILASAN